MEAVSRRLGWTAIAGLFGAFLLLGAPGTARASSIGACDGGFSLGIGSSCDFDVLVNGSDSIKGTLTFLDMRDDFKTLVFQVSIASDSDVGLEQIQPSAVGECSFPTFNCLTGTGLETLGAGEVPITNVSGDIFSFDGAPSPGGGEDGAILPGETGQGFSITYANALTTPGSLNFMLNPQSGLDPDLNIGVPYVPEPSTALLLGVGLAGLGLARRRR